MATSEGSQSKRPVLEDEKWIFSIPLPDSAISSSSSSSSPSVDHNHPKNYIELITTHQKFHETPSKPNLQAYHQREDVVEDRTTMVQTSSNSYDDSDLNDKNFGTKISETKSLLDNHLRTENANGFRDGVSKVDDSSPQHPQQQQRPEYCWRFYSPLYGMELQSSTLLRLSYRPAWQGIPEYTKNSSRRRLYRALTSCCCPTDEEDVVNNEEQIWEVYTTRHISHVEKVDAVQIRGIGQCQAVHVYLKVLGDSNVDSMATPRQFQAALELHRQRMEHQSKNSWTRFTGPGDSLEDDNDDDKDDMIILTFAVPLTTEAQHDPPLLWKVRIPPKRSDHRMVLDNITVLDGHVDLQEPPTHVYIQGYQSWSFSGSVWKGQKQPQPAMLDVFSKAFNLGGCLPDLPTTVLPAGDTFANCQPDLLCSTSPGSVTATKSSSNISNESRTSSLNSVSPNRPNLRHTSSSSRGSPSISNKAQNHPYRSDYFACITTGRDEIMDENGGPAVICGWLSQHHQFGVVSIDESLQDITMHLTHQAIPKSRVETDWAIAQLVSPHHYDEECMVHFLHAAAAYNQAKPLQNGPLLTGWCSWYHYYENISESNLRSNFEKLASMKDKVPTNVAVVDDGYMTAWGDWSSLKPKKFTDMSVVASDIATSRMRPGLWLAPFAADKHSKIARDHPEWIIRNDRGVPANSSNCGKFFYGLDATNPQVREHAFKAIRRAVRDWGFQVLKIDFLYAACLEGNGKYDMSMTRAEAMHLALQTIREAAGPDVFLIGCGCPIGTAIGYVDGMRVSADTGPTWYPALPLPWWDHGTLPSVRAMIRNSMSRAPMGHRFWLNDPDCLLLRESTSLTDEEVTSAASIIAMTCGMMLISDDLTKVSFPRMKLLTQIFPMTGVSAVVLDLHTTTNKGMPSLLRLWCTDRYGRSEAYRQTSEYYESVESEDFNAEATYFGRSSAFDFEARRPSIHERHRSCIHVAKGLGTWTVISISNWDDQPQVMHIPRLAISAPSETGWAARKQNSSSSSIIKADDEEEGCAAGYHVFSFWSSRYTWLSLSSANGHPVNAHPISRRLQSHETEIFHIRKVIPNSAQYIGSDLHFSCGHEVLSFDTSGKNRISIQLKTELGRVGHIFLFVPVVDTSHVKCVLAGKQCKWSVVANVPDEDGTSRCCGRIIRVMVVVHADRSENDGQVVFDY